MPLVNCPQCGKPISDRAKRCPHCGCDTTHSDAPKKSHKSKIVLIVLAICAICAGLFFVLRNSQNDADEVNTEDGEAVEEVSVVEESVEATVIENPICNVDSNNYHDVDGDALYLWLLKEHEQGRDWRLKDSDVNKLTEEQKAALGIAVQSVEIVVAPDEDEDMPVTTHSTEIIIREVEDEVAPANENMQQQAVKKEVANTQPEPEDDRIWSSSEVDSHAQFPGGDDALLKYIEDKIQYPQDAKDEGIQGRIVVRAIIDRNGNISTATVVRGKHSSLDKEAIRIVKNLPKFVPARRNGQSVKSEYIIPISFKIQ